jgi:hypothetical protein
MAIIDIDSPEEALESKHKVTVGCQMVRELQELMEDPAI